MHACPFAQAHLDGEHVAFARVTAESMKVGEGAGGLCVCDLS